MKGFENPKPCVPTSTRVRRRAVFAILPLLALLASCITSSGGTLAKTSAAESPKPSKAHEQAPETQRPEPGLEIITNPPGVEVYLNDVYQGTTPVVVRNLSEGHYRLAFYKTGYYDRVDWVNYSGDFRSVFYAMSAITGYLQLSVTPPDCVSTFAGIAVALGVQVVPIGTHPLVVRAFGYRDDLREITIAENATTTVDVTLLPAEFSMTEVGLSRKVVNPDNPGALGELRLTFKVTTAGAAKVSVIDSSSKTVSERELPPFTTWQQDLPLDLRDSEGKSLGDGHYRVFVSAQGSTGGPPFEQTAEFDVDRSWRVAARSSWSGTSGLLYVSSPEALPRGSFQVSFLAAGGTDGPLVRLPLQLSARVGIADILELGAETAFIVSSSMEHSLPVSLGVSAKVPLLRARQPLGFGAAAEAKAAIQVIAAAEGYEDQAGPLTTDTFSNFSGLSLGFPLQLTLGKLNVLAEAAAIVSPWRVSYAAAADQSPASWLYFRGGLLLDLSELTVGVSASARTNPLPQGILSIGLPFQAGMEVHWFIPRTHILLSAILVGEIEDTTNYYFLGGGGAALLF